MRTLLQEAVDALLLEPELSGSNGWMSKKDLLQGGSILTLEDAKFLSKMRLEYGGDFISLASRDEMKSAGVSRNDAFRVLRLRGKVRTASQRTEDIIRWYSSRKGIIP